MKMTIKGIVAATCVLGSMGAYAVPVPIDGELSLRGDVKYTANLSVTRVTHIDFINDRARVRDTSGDFVGIADGTIAAMTDFDVFTGLPVIPLWSVGGFTFDLISISRNSIGGGRVVVGGEGVLKHRDFEDTRGWWSIITDTSSSSLSKVRFSKQYTSTVPEPGLVGLLGLGLVGVAVAARRRRDA